MRGSLGGDSLSAGEQPLRTANITRLRVIYRDYKSDVSVLLALRDELKSRKRTTGVRELLASVQQQLSRIMSTRQVEMSGGESTPNDTVSASDETGKRGRALTDREAAAQKRIADLRMRLLDLSNANRLLNYKFGNRSRRQVRLVDELPNQILARLKEGKRLTFKPLPEPDDEPSDEKTDEFLLALAQLKASDQDYIEAISNVEDDDGEVARRIERTLRDRLRQNLGMPDRRVRDQIGRVDLARRVGIDPSFDLPVEKDIRESHVDGDLQTLLLPDEMERTLSSVADQYRSSLQETGVNTLYLALGYLEWYEATNSATPLYAPLLLHPIEIERKLAGTKYRYTIGSIYDESEVNITLSERLHQDFHRRLPDLADDDTPETYFEKVEHAVRDIPGWRVRRFAVVGHFAFARLVMFKDLEESRWPAGVGIIGNSVISGLFAGQAANGTGFFAEDYEVDHPSVATKVPLLITDADSSQFSAIVDVMDGKNLAVKGPPGTGKSQTITNIIAAALASGKTVLFVAEKMAALNVVKDRLEKAGLAHFCLELHSTKSRKVEILKSLDERLDIQDRLREAGQLSGALQDLERTREQLSGYVATINRAFGEYGKTIHGILWSEQRTRDEGNVLPKSLDNAELAGATKLTRHDLAGLHDKLQVYAKAHADAAGVEGINRHPWCGVRHVPDYFQREQLIQDLKGLREGLVGLDSALDESRSSTGHSHPKTLADARRLTETLNRLPASTGDMDFGLYVALEDEDSFAALNRFRADQLNCLEARRRVAEFFADPEKARRVERLQEAATLAEQVRAADLPISSLQERARNLAAEAYLVERAIAYGLRLAELVGLQKPMTAGKLRALSAAAKLAASLSADLRPFRIPGLLHDMAPALLVDAAKRAEGLNNRVKSLTTRLLIELDGEPHEWRNHAQTMRTFPSRFWRKDVRAAKNRHHGLLRVREKWKATTMADDFEAIAECVEIAGSFASDEGLRTICGPYFRARETPFAELHVVSTYVTSVKQSYRSTEPNEDKVRRALLESSSDELARIAGLSEHADAGAAAQIATSIDDQELDLDHYQQSLVDRSSKMLELDSLVQSLAIKAHLRIGEIKTVAKTVGEWLDAEVAISSNGRARDVLGERCRGADSDPSAIVSCLQAASEVNEAALPSTIRHYLYNAERDRRIASLQTIKTRVDEALATVDERWAAATEHGDIDAVAFLECPMHSLDIEKGISRITRAIEAPEQLAVWSSWLAARHDCVESGLGPIIEAFADDSVEASQRLSKALERVFWRSVARATFSEYPLLGRFRGLQLEAARARFRKLDEEILSMQRTALAADLCRRPIDRGLRGVYRKEDTGLVLIHHEIGKQKRHIPLREIFDRAGVSIQQMKPCFMMSPLSVAQFLKPQGIRFDLVIIDEASQMRPEEALGAVARGGQVVVVGDPMQLPPTSFFDRGDRLDEEQIDEEEIVDNESILDLALAEFRPSRTLRWHYRSRHESLIAFSNRQFYNDLIVFPSPLDPDRRKREPKLGVYHHFVAGKYKGRINIEEAQAVAEAALEFMIAEPDKSLGVVTLNQTQRDVLLEELERLVARERAAQKYTERWEQTLEPFFVKNLENVQGDERDVIFISTVYGPDAETGVVMNRFGPINGRHGHRRLNVLFTRAKDRVEIFTSMRPTDIKVEEGAQLGVRTLKAYLEYAETGQLDAGAMTRREPDSEFEELIRDRLVERGFEVVPQVGVAGYFIDLAVKHPKRSGFVLGIECDGAGYRSSRSARDRDRLRQQVLERLQWNIYRIWSTDWFDNPGRELGKLLSHIDRLVAAS